MLSHYNYTDTVKIKALKRVSKYYVLHDVAQK